MIKVLFDFGGEDLFRAYPGSANRRHASRKDCVGSQITSSIHQTTQPIANPSGQVLGPVRAPVGSGLLRNTIVLSQFQLILLLPFSRVVGITFYDGEVTPERRGNPESQTLPLSQLPHSVGDFLPVDSHSGRNLCFFRT